MIRKITAAIALVIVVAGCGGGTDEEPTTADVDTTAQSEPTAEPIEEPTAESTTTPAPDPLASEPVPEGIIDMIEGLAMPDGALQVQRAAMVRYLDVYYIVATEIKTPRGVVEAAFLHAPADQDDLGNGGLTQPLDETITEFAPFASVADDPNALALAQEIEVE